LILVFLGWTVLSAPWFWTTFVAAVLILPSLLIAAWDMLRKPADVLFKHHVQNSVRATYRSIVQALFTFYLFAL